MPTLKKLIKKVIKILFLPGMNFINRHPKLRLYAIAVVKKLGLHKIVRFIYRRFTIVSLQVETINYVDELTPRANQIYIDLTAAIKKRKRGNC